MSDKKWMERKPKCKHMDSTKAWLERGHENEI